MGAGTVASLWAKNERNQGVTIFNFVINNAITIQGGASFNLFNSTNGMFSNNGTLSISGDSWDRTTIFDGDFIRPDTYLHSKNPYQSIETNIFARIPVDLNGNNARSVRLEVRRRTTANPTTPLAIPNRGIELFINTQISAATLQNLPTRSEGITDNYNVFGYALYVVSQTNNTVTLSAGQTIRVEITNTYKKPIFFKTLQSSNL